ncbi:MAG: J domain-containing protein [Actinomycetota bacterium]|nr:J domain-containing protein [Actinomycetota bacterium]
MLLAELEIFHTRPTVPTRRIALGHMVLPVDPAPGFGGLLLGSVVAAHLGGLNDDQVADVHRLITEVGQGGRVVQPRLRHRFQVDRHGLAVSNHRLIGNGDEISFDFNSTGTDLSQVLGAIYAAERLAPEYRRSLADLLQKASRWRGPIGAAFIAYLAGSQTITFEALADPLGWALGILGFELGTKQPSQREVTSEFRKRMRDVHPDHGGDQGDAAKAMSDLAEARRILNAKI